jgi:hypothetical protein
MEITTSITTVNKYTEDQVIETTGQIRTTKEILDAIDAYCLDHIVYRKEYRTIQTLWTYGSYFLKYADIPVFDNYPILFFKSMDEDSGKTRALEVIEQLAHNPTPPGSYTAASLCRLIDKQTAKGDMLSWILDEADETLLVDQGNADYNRLLNNGTSRGKVIVRCGSDDAEIKITQAYCPKALGGLSITRLKGTTRSRTLTIPMRPSKPGEHYRPHLDKETAQKIKADIQVSHSAILDDLKQIDEKKLSKFINRKSQILHPLLALAQLAGSEWFDRAIKAVELVVYQKQTKDKTEKEAVFRKLFELYNASRYQKYKTGIQLAELAKETKKDVEVLKEYFGENGYDIPRSQVNHMHNGKWENKSGLKWVDCERRFVDYGLHSYDVTDDTGTTEKGDASGFLSSASTDFTNTTNEQQDGTLNRQIMIMQDDFKYIPFTSDLSSNELTELEGLYLQ